MPGVTTAVSNVTLFAVELRMDSFGIYPRPFAKAFRTYRPSLRTRAFGLRANVPEALTVPLARATSYRNQRLLVALKENSSVES